MKLKNVYLLSLIIAAAIILVADLIIIYLLHLYLYFAVIIAFILYSAVALRILYEYGYVGDASRVVAVSYAAIAFLLITVSVLLLIIFGGVYA